MAVSIPISPQNAQYSSAADFNFTVPIDMGLVPDALLGMAVPVTLRASFASHSALFTTTTISALSNLSVLEATNYAAVLAGCAKFNGKHVPIAEPESVPAVSAAAGEPTAAELHPFEFSDRSKTHFAQEVLKLSKMIIAAKGRSGGDSCGSMQTSTRHKVEIVFDSTGIESERLSPYFIWYEHSSGALEQLSQTALRMLQHDAMQIWSSADATWCAGMFPFLSHKTVPVSTAQICDAVRSFQSEVPLVTFVVPSIGRSSLIHTLDSLRAQTIPHWRAIVVLDGAIAENSDEGGESTGSPLMADPGGLLPDRSLWTHSGENDPRISFLPMAIKQDHMSNHAARIRNAAAPHITTRWVAFVDDDDNLVSTYIEHLEEELTTDPGAECVIFRMFRKNDNNVLPRPTDDNFRFGFVGISFALHTTTFRHFKFDPSCGEDFDLLSRIRQTGRLIVLSPYVGYVVGVGKSSNNPMDITSLALHIATRQNITRALPKLGRGSAGHFFEPLPPEVIPGDFDWRLYLRLNGDLVDAGITTQGAAEAHYLQNVRVGEGRKYTMDWMLKPTDCEPWSLPAGHTVLKYAISEVNQPILAKSRNIHALLAVQRAMMAAKNHGCIHGWGNESLEFLFAGSEMGGGLQQNRNSTPLSDSAANVPDDSQYVILETRARPDFSSIYNLTLHGAKQVWVAHRETAAALANCAGNWRVRRICVPMSRVFYVPGLGQATFNYSLPLCYALRTGAHSLNIKRNRHHLWA
jgi:hypothetical protein